MQELYFNHYFYGNNNIGNGYFFADGKITEIDDFILYPIANDNILVSRMIGEGNIDLIRNLSLTKEFQCERVFISSLIESNFIYSRSIESYTILKKVSLLDGNLIWQINLKTLGKYFKKEYRVGKIIGIHNDEFLVGCENGVLLAINPDTGAIIYQWQEKKNSENIMVGETFVGSSHSCVILPQEHKLVGGGGTAICEVNLITRAVVTHHLRDKLKDNKLGDLFPESPYAMSDTHFITTSRTYTDNHDDWTPSYMVLLAINKQTFEIDWRHDFSKAISNKTINIARESTKVVGNKIYHLKEDGELFIFEKV